jgi:hypothetical protein
MPHHPPFGAVRRLRGVVRHVVAAEAVPELSEDELHQGGRGVVVPAGSAAFFGVEEEEAALKYFKVHGFVCVRGALDRAEIDHLNAFCDHTQKCHPNHEWVRRDTSKHMIFSQPLLDHPELDVYAIGHPSTRLAERLVGGRERLRTYEFNFRDSPAGSGRGLMRYHHDSVQANRTQRHPYFPLDAMCVIRYLTDVTPETPAFAVVPGSCRFETLADMLAQAPGSYRELGLYAPAGTSIYYDNATHHTRLDGSAEPSLGRRTLHQYFARGGWDATTSAGVRPPTPPQVRETTFRHICHAIGSLFRGHS